MTSMGYIEVAWYGTTSDGVPVRSYILTNPAGMTVTIITYGGILTSVRVPDRHGEVANVTLGLRDLAAYETRSPYFGCITGRYANRIAGARFVLDGQEVVLAANQGTSALHGGRRGFDKVVWEAHEVQRDGGPALRLAYRSPHMEEGYPGTLDVAVTYALTDDDRILIDYEAVTDRPTVVNLTNHAYWNLGGEGTGTIDDHVLEIDADRYTPVDATQIPTGELAPVEGTPFDFRTPTPIGERVRQDHPQLIFGRGYDQNWVLGRPSPDDGSVRLAARVADPASGRVLEVWTDQPGVQLYSGNSLDGSIVGPSGRAYRQGDGFALETQHFPDSPNHPDFPSTILRSGETYRTRTIYAFGVDGVRPG